MASFGTPASELKTGDFIYGKSCTVQAVDIIGDEGVVVTAKHNGTGHSKTLTYANLEEVWIHRTNHSFT